MKYNTIIILVFVVIFLLGLYLYSNSILDKTFRKSKKNIKINKHTNMEKYQKTKCPSVLVRRGEKVYMYNSTNINQEMPTIFNNLDEYVMYVEQQRTIGNNCPILYLQQENDIQGRDVLIVRPNPFRQPDAPIPEGFENPVPIVDANQESPVYNTNQYPGFDPIGLHVGVYNKLDQIHDSTQTEGQYSDNPMDSNWGGVDYTEKAVSSGKYDDNNITSVQYFQPPTQFIPGLYGAPTPSSYSDMSMPEQDKKEINH
jgi:hypothetical protein